MWIHAMWSIDKKDGRQMQHEFPTDKNWAEVIQATIRPQIGWDVCGSNCWNLKPITLLFLFLYNFKIFVSICYQCDSPFLLFLLPCPHCRSHSKTLDDFQDHVVDFTLHHLGWHASYRRWPRLAPLCPLDALFLLGAVGQSGVRKKGQSCWWVAQLWKFIGSNFWSSKILS